MFSTFRKRNIANRKTDEALYSIIASEINRGIRHEGLWLKALERANGNSEKQIAEYISLRVQSLKDDINILSDNSSRMETGHGARPALLTANILNINRDIEGLMELLDKRPTIEDMKMFFSGMTISEASKILNQPDICENYALHTVIKYGNIEVVKYFLQLGANPNLTNYWGSTALEVAKKNDNIDAILLLESYN